jgi:hypothetical protein
MTWTLFSKGAWLPVVTNGYLNLLSLKISQRMLQAASQLCSDKPSAEEETHGGILD